MYQYFLSKIELNGNDIRSLNEKEVKKYPSTGTRGLNLKESIKGLVADIQMAKGVEIEVRQ